MEVLDTTLRDGEQTPGVSFSSKEKVLIAEKLFDIGVSRIEVASAMAIDEDKKAVKEICEMAAKIGKHGAVEVLGFISEKSIDWIKEAGALTVNLLAKGSLEHCEKQLKKTRQQHLIDIENIVKYAKSKEMTVNIYLEDWSNGMLNSREYVFNLIEKLSLMDISRIMLPDTLGILDPKQTREFLKEIIERFADSHFDYHAHNDYGLALANTLSAITTKIKGVHVTVNSLGERTGNCDLFMLGAASKDFLGLDLHLKENSFSVLSNIVAEASTRRVPPNQPIIGKNVYEQTAGIHADGDSKGNLYQSSLAAARFGKKPGYALGKQAGKASIVMNLKELGIIEPDSEIVRNLVNRVREIGTRKEAMTQADLWVLYWEIVDQDIEAPFTVIDIRATSCLHGPAQCYAKIRFNEKTYENIELGDGAYNAFMNVVKKIMKKENITLPLLVDYDPRIPPGGGSDALVETTIEWKNNGKTFPTVGVDTDQFLSAVRATQTMINLVVRKIK